MAFSTNLREYLHKINVKYMIFPPPPDCDASQVQTDFDRTVGEIAMAFIFNADKSYEMLALSASENVDMEQLRSAVGVDSARLAHERECKKLFPECDISAIPILGNYFNMRVYCSTRLLQQRSVSFNAGSHDEIIKIPIEDFIKVEKPIAIPYPKRSERAREPEYFI